MTSELPCLEAAATEIHPKPLDLSPWMVAAETNFQRGDLAAATESLQEALRAKPEDFEVLMCLGNVQYHAKDLPGAVASFSRAAEQRPDAILAHLSRASALVEKGDFLESEGAVRLALALEPANVSALKLLSRLLLNGRRFKAAAPVCEKILKHCASDPGAWLALGRCRYEAGDRNGARLAFEEVLRHDPDNAVAADNLALLLKQNPVAEAASRPATVVPTSSPIGAMARVGGSEKVIREIGAGDEMYTGNQAHYFGVGESALHCIDAALRSVHKERQQVRRILDLPCGHGRVMRHLKAAFPHAEITGCDLNRSAVDFCAATFGSVPVYSEIDVRQIPIRTTFDMIWSGSLLTHLRPGPCSEFVRWWHSLLQPGGLMIFTLHGRWAERNLATGRYKYGLPEDRVTALLQEYYATGFGYTDYPSQRGYGISLTSPPYALAQLAALPDLRLVGYHEKGWDNHQDVLCFQKQPASELLG